MCGGEWTEPSLCLLELPLAARPLSTAGLVPGDDDMDEPLEEVLLGRLGGAPGILERLVCREVLSRSRQLQAAREVS